MSITLTTPIQTMDLKGDIASSITKVKIGEVLIADDGTMAKADILDFTTNNRIGFIPINTPAAIANIKAQIETYAISQGLIVGTKD